MKFNSLIPELLVKDLKESMHFYMDILGFKKEYERDNFVFLSFQGSQIMMQELGSESSKLWVTGKMEHPYGRGINLQIEVATVNEIINSLEKAKYPIHMPLKVSLYRCGDKTLGNREFLAKDPDGYLLRFFEDLGVQ